MLEAGLARRAIPTSPEHRDSPVRVLWIVHYGTFSGPHNRILRLHARLRAAGVHVTALLPDDPGNATRRLRDDGVEVLQRPLGRVRATLAPSEHISMLAGLRRDVGMVRRILRAGFDAVIVSGLVNPHGPIAARLEGVPLVWQVIDTRTPPLGRRATMPIAYRLADALMFGGQRLMDLHLGSRTPRQPSFISVPPVDVDRFVPSPVHRARTRRVLGIPDSSPVIGTVANLNPQKGLEHFVRAAALVHRRDPSCHFVIAGATYATHRAYAASIQAALAASDIPGAHIHLLGARDDVETVYPALDVKLISSVPRSEGTTTTAIEAMACAVPVVATDVGAVAEVVEHERTGLVVAPSDPAALAAGALTLLADAGRRAALGRRGRLQAATRYSAERAAEVHLAAIAAARAHMASRGHVRLTASARP